MFAYPQQLNFTGEQRCERQARVDSDACNALFNVLFRPQPFNDAQLGKRLARDSESNNYSALVALINRQDHDEIAALTDAIKAAITQQIPHWRDASYTLKASGALNENGEVDTASLKSALDTALFFAAAQRSTSSNTPTDQTAPTDFDLAVTTFIDDLNRLTIFDAEPSGTLNGLIRENRMTADFAQHEEWLEKLSYDERLRLFARLTEDYEDTSDLTDAAYSLLSANEIYPREAHHYYWWSYQTIFASTARARVKSAIEQGNVDTWTDKLISAIAPK